MCIHFTWHVSGLIPLPVIVDVLNIELCCFFAGCSATSDDGSARHLRIFKHITDLFQTVNLSTEVTTELTGMLLNEVLYSVTEISIIS